MIVSVDGGQLEWRTALFMSQDQLGIQELLNGVDLHTANQERFGLPSRLIAKTYLFRLLYGGSAYSYANDPDFSTVSKSEKYWQKIIDQTYEKYTGLAAWHKKLVQTAIETGQITTPSGRTYVFNDPMKERTKILNYPVQGFGADIMMVVRISIARRLKALNKPNEIKLINTVHDSIMVDCEDNLLDTVANVFYTSFVDLPSNLSKMFNINFNIPITCEVSYGKSWGTEEEWTPKN